MKRVLLPMLLLLAACGTPQEQCISRNTRELRTVEKLIAETSGNLQRGYAIEEYTVYDEVWSTCHRRIVVPGVNGGAASVTSEAYSCLKDVRRTERRPKAIDLEAEGRKLAQLRDQQARLKKQAESVVRQCQALYPEAG